NVGTAFLCQLAEAESGGSGNGLGNVGVTFACPNYGNAFRQEDDIRLLVNRIFDNVQETPHAFCRRARALRPEIDRGDGDVAWRRSGNLLQRDIVPPDSSLGRVGQVELDHHGFSFLRSLSVHGQIGTRAFAASLV